MTQEEVETLKCSFIGSFDDSTSRLHFALELNIQNFSSLKNTDSLKQICLWKAFNIIIVVWLIKI